MANRRRIVGSARLLIEEEKNKKAEAFWSEVEEDKEYTGTVKSLTKFGAFVDLGGVDGLIHISELSWKKIDDPSEVLNVGDTVTVRVIGIDRERRRSLSVTGRRRTIPGTVSGRSTMSVMW